LTDSAGTT